jgi:hypothetical protein
MNISFLRIAVATLACFGLGISAKAQSVTATLVGTVFDSSKAAVPGPRIPSPTRPPTSHTP